jgi:hypothetical protein
MYRLLPLFIWTVCSSAIIPIAFALPLIAHQEKTASSVGAMIHLDPNDSPYAATVYTQVIESSQIAP